MTNELKPLTAEEIENLKRNGIKLNIPKVEEIERLFSTIDTLQADLSTRPELNCYIKTDAGIETLQPGSIIDPKDLYDQILEQLQAENTQLRKALNTVYLVFMNYEGCDPVAFSTKEKAIAYAKKRYSDAVYKVVVDDQECSSNVVWKDGESL